MGVMTKVKEPTEWVSSLAYAMKASSNAQVCLVPKDWNAAIWQDHHWMPKVNGSHMSLLVHITSLMLT